MNRDSFEHHWEEMRGPVKEWWTKLTDDDLEEASGNADRLIHLLQQRYGYTREQAAEEFHRRLWETPNLKIKNRSTSGL